MMKSTWLMYFFWGLGGYIVLTGLFYIVSDSVIYQPPPPSKVQLPHSVKVPLPNGQHLSAVYLHNPNAKYTILLSNGNATDVARMYRFLQQLEWHDFSVISYDYRGYGHSPGRSSEKNTYEDIQAVYDYLTNKLNVSPNNIILMGMSLGTGPTIELGLKVPAAGMVLQSPFVSAYRIKTVIPLILFDKYENLKKVPKIKFPVLVIQGTDDYIVPTWHADKIFKAIQSSKQVYWVEGAGHNDLFEVSGDTYFEKLKNFTDSL